MPDATFLDQATNMIESRWGRSIAELEKRALELPHKDPLRSVAIRIRSGLVVTDNATRVRQERLHALTWPGRETEFHDLDRITTVASDLRASQAESLTSLRAIGLVIETHEDLDTSPQHAPAASRTQAAVARSAPSTHPSGTKSGAPAPIPAVGPQTPVRGPHR